ncbi:MAG: hypothetical protein JWN44_2498 [Myxococcales bacterium]|nr:hypothetical protein [Myxococcales bacterium]
MRDAEAKPFDAVVDALVAEATGDREAWQRDGWARAARAVGDEGEQFIEWASAHRRWSFVVAEAADAVCAKPGEAAAWVAHAIVEERLEDGDEAADDDG